MSSLGNLTNIRTVIYEHTNHGLYNYNLGKNLLKDQNPNDYKIANLIKANITEIRAAVSKLQAFDGDTIADIAVSDLLRKAQKLEKRFENARTNSVSAPLLKYILDSTKFNEIGEKEAEDLVNQVINISQYSKSSKITSLSLEIFSKLSKFAPKAPNNNNAPIVIENPKKEEENFGELLIEVPFQEEEGEGEEADFDKQPFFNLHDSFHPQQGFDPNVYFNPEKQETFVDSNNNLDAPHHERPDSIMNDINDALDLVLKAKPNEFAKRLQEFSKEIEKFGGALSEKGIINFEHTLHGQIFKYYTGKGYETNDVEGMPFARYAMESGLVTQEELTQCCRNTKTLVYLDILRALIEDKTISEADFFKYSKQFINELEEHHAQTAWIVFGETSNFGTAEEKKLVDGDFGRNGFVSDKVSRETKLQAVLKTIELCTARIKEEYNQQ